VAAGGGGDVIAAAMVQRALSECGARQPFYYASYAWERREVDPLPGPRDPTAFAALKPVPVELSGHGLYGHAASSQVSPASAGC
jgi:hypothetical protein